MELDADVYTPSGEEQPHKGRNQQRLYKDVERVDVHALEDEGGTEQRQREQRGLHFTKPDSVLQITRR